MGTMRVMGATLLVATALVAVPLHAQRGPGIQGRGGPNMGKSLESVLENQEELGLSQDQIARLLGKKHFDKVTIYRTLESLLKVGLVHKAFIEKRACHYELAHNCTASQCHPHFTCTSCGKTHCLTEISLPMAKSPHKGFVIQRQQVRLEGLCPACA